MFHTSAAGTRSCMTRFPNHGMWSLERVMWHFFSVMACRGFHGFLPLMFGMFCLASDERCGEHVIPGAHERMGCIRNGSASA